MIWLCADLGTKAGGTVERDEHEQFRAQSLNAFRSTRRLSEGGNHDVDFHRAASILLVPAASDVYRLGNNNTIAAQMQ